MESEGNNGKIDTSLNEKFSSSYGDILRLISDCKVLVKNSAKIGLISLGINVWIGSAKIFLASYFSVFAFHGAFPVNI